MYLPVETPTSDHYGGHRPGNNLFAESLVAVDLKTGKRKWHFQFVHHPLWNLDISSAPLLADINVNGRAIKAVAVPSKQNFLYVFDRVTGEPVWPIEERPVPRGDVPGETYSPTQPFPTKPPVYARNFVNIPDDIIDFTPELRAQALSQLSRYKPGPLFNPPILGTNDGLLGSLSIGNLGGGTNWPGGGYDPELHIAFAPASNAGINSHSLVTPPEGFSDIRYVRGVAASRSSKCSDPGTAARRIRLAQSRRRREAQELRNCLRQPWLPKRWRVRRSFRPADSRCEGLPIMKPPYGVLAAIQLDRGELLWQVPHGDTPDGVRNHPALKGLDDSEDRSERRGRPARDEDARDHGRSAGDHHTARAGRDAAGVRQGDGRRGGSDFHPGAAKRLADDLQHRRPAVHRRGRERRGVLGRVHCLRTA